jgi:hypothetical protein
VFFVFLNPIPESVKIGPPLGFNPYQPKRVLLDIQLKPGVKLIVAADGGEAAA